ncbi:MAG TPA: CARDB domain-containing protein [Vicinamibacterales bacterium]|nr:CARDB domain-containing protein [Vicinamibacterales bacterium]
MRKIVVGTLAAIGLCIAMTLPVVALPKLPPSLRYDSLQGWCNENGGFFWADDSSLKTYGCIFDDGSYIVCTQNAGKAPSCEEGQPVPFFPAPKHPVTQQLLNDEKEALIAVQSDTTTLNNVATQVAAILASQKEIASAVNGVQQSCSTADLLPLPMPAVAGPTGYCRMGSDGKLQVLVYNQGGSAAGATTTRVTFNTTTGPMAVDAPTSALTASGGSEVVEFTIPGNCTGNTGCEFSIGVDATNLVPESNESNNTVAGTCVPVIF